MHDCGLVSDWELVVGGGFVSTAERVNAANGETSSRSPVVRRHYAFALRDDVPVPDGGWTQLLHPPDCMDEQSRNLTCKGESCVRALRCQLFVTDGDDLRFPGGMDDLSVVLGKLTGNTSAGPPHDGLAPRSRRVVAVVGAPVDEERTGGHYDACMAALHGVVKAFRLATGAHTPNVTIERVWPIYFVLAEHADGTYEVTNIVMVEHGWRTVPVPDAAQTQQAQNVWLAARRGSPVEIYRDFELDAQRAAATEGDYVECVLKAAAAAEVLLRHTAWMLTWEATQVLAQDPAKLALPAADAKPNALIAAVLMPRLKGSWASNSTTQPVGAWRQHIAQQRNKVIHLGNRPGVADANAAVAALHTLEQHILSRLAQQAAVYPRTALQLVGKESLEKRGAFGKARATYEGELLSTRLAEYLSWLAIYLGSDVED